MSSGGKNNHLCVELVFEKAKRDNEGCEERRGESRD